VYYGRAVIPDVWMLACMLVSAYCYRRFVDQPRWRWLLACGLAGLAAVAFKYYGLMVLVAIFEMAARRRGIRALVSYEFWVPAAIVIVTLAIWMWAVFAALPNPAQTSHYFLFQQPEVLGDRRLWSRLLGRFLWKDCGPITTLLIPLGAFAVAFRHAGGRGLAVWTFIGLGFYFLTGPKSLGHDYYELMMLPGAVLWAALGWDLLWQSVARGNARLKPRGACLLAGVLVAAVVVSSPWVARSRFRQENGFVLAAERLNELCPPDGRVVVGPATPQPIIHYARCEGWTWHENRLPQWRSLLAGYQRHGARLVALYFDGKMSAEDRRSYAEMLSTLPIAEHRMGNFNYNGPGEFYILRLEGVQLAVP
jgi:hypothetical protein